MNGRILIPTSAGVHVPALLCRAAGKPIGTALVLHGLGGSKEVQRKELDWLAAAGFDALCPDAPHHGERADEFLRETASAADAHERVMQMVREAIAEIPAMVDFCAGTFSPDIGLVGISLGGYIAFGAAIREKRLKACVPILGSPDWKSDDSPRRYPEKFPPCALFAACAGRDASVPPEAARSFLHLLKPYYALYPDRLRYAEYPESEHMMRDQDWIHLWGEVTAWLQHFLPLPMPKVPP